MIAELLQKAIDGKRITPEEGLYLLEKADLLSLGDAANKICNKMHPESYRTFNIDRNINYVLNLQVPRVVACTCLASKECTIKCRQGINALRLDLGMFCCRDFT